MWPVALFKPKLLRSMGKGPSLLFSGCQAQSRLSEGAWKLFLQALGQVSKVATEKPEDQTQGSCDGEQTLSGQGHGASSGRED